MKKIFVVLIVAIALTVATTSVAFAADTWTPGMSQQPGYASNAQAGGGYCAQLDPDQMEQFKADRLAQYNERLDAAVASGNLTQEQADEYYTSKKAAMDSCTGNGSANRQSGFCANGTSGVCNGNGNIGSRGCRTASN